VSLTAAWIRPGHAHAVPEIDRATLEGCRAGDATALGVFVRRHQAMVFAFLSRTLGAGSHVEDLAQEVFLRACRALPGFDVSGTARLSTWLLTIASHVATDARRKRRLPFAQPDADRLVVAPDTPETERRRLEIGCALGRAAAQLSDVQRDVFVLAEFHDLDTRAIASVLGIRESTVKTRLFRARERLRELLRGVWEER
jgi:RNA polymerase sigma-70 factor, ECF subfamily